MYQKYALYLCRSYEDAIMPYNFDTCLIDSSLLWSIKVKINNSLFCHFLYKFVPWLYYCTTYTKFFCFTENGRFVFPCNFAARCSTYMYILCINLRYSSAVSETTECLLLGIHQHVEHWTFIVENILFAPINAISNGSCKIG